MLDTIDDPNSAYRHRVHRFAELDLRDRSTWRRIWGTGIGAVMTLAVVPYPFAGLFVANEVPHRIHNIVGAVQYLPLWAVPVLMLTWGRDVSGAAKVALASSGAMFAVGVWSGDLVPSLSWMPLVTLLPLVLPMRGWAVRPNAPFTIAAAGALVVAIRHAPTLVGYQRLGMGDSHTVRFHFSGMAASYLSMTATLIVCAAFTVGTTLRRVVAATVLGAGVVTLIWPYSESSLPRTDALVLVACGLVAAVACRRRTPATLASPPLDRTAA